MYPISPYPFHSIIKKKEKVIVADNRPKESGVLD